MHRRIPRRTPLAWAASSLVLAAATTAALAQDAKKPAKPVELQLYNFAEYLDPEILEGFEKKTGVKVKESYYEATEEMVAKLQHAGGARQYDLVVVTDQAVPNMARLDLLRPLDHKKIPNLANLAPRFRNLDVDPGNRYQVAYQWGTVGLLDDQKKHPGIDSWAVLFDPAKQVGSFLLIDEMRDQLGVALKYLGYGVNSTVKEEVAKAGQLLATAKKSKHSLGFEGGVGAKNRVAAGEASMGVVWNGDAMRGIEEDEDGRLAYVVPKEGSIVWTDTIAIPKDAPHPAEAHAFIDYLLEPEVGAKLSNFNKFATPNEKAMPFIDPADAANPILYPPADVMAKLSSLRDVGEHTTLYDEVWTAVKSR